MIKNKFQKGEYGYLGEQKKRAIQRTVLYYALSLSIFLLGIYSTGSRENLLTVVAVLGLLPASKSTVSMIILLRTPAYSESLHTSLQSLAGELNPLYTLYLTSYQKNYPLSCVVVRDHQIIAYTEFDTCDTKACEEHMQSMLKQNAIGNCHIKIFEAKELRNFEEHLKQLQHAKVSAQDEAITVLLGELSL